MNKRIIDRATAFMRSWVKTNWDLVPGLCEVREPDFDQVIVDFAIEEVGRNVLFETFTQKIQVTFRLTKNKYGTFIWSVTVSFQFKDGGSNGWIHPRNFKLVEGKFIEMVNKESQ